MYKSLINNKNFRNFFFIQFLGAFNDNVYKNALVILFTFYAISIWGLENQILVTFAFGLFILPFFLFSALAGQLTDQYDKLRIIRYVKFSEVMIMLMAVIGLWGQYYGFLLLVLFLMGLQSTFFGPIKYSVLPLLSQQIDAGRGYANILIQANGLVEMATFVAILLGTIAGGFLVSSHFLFTCFLPFFLVFIAFIGWALSWKLSLGPQERFEARPQRSVDWNFFRSTVRVIIDIEKKPLIFRLILLISWFWFVGAAVLSQIPSWTKNVLLGDEHGVTLLLACFTLGVGLGSLLCPLFFRKISAKKFFQLAVGGISFSLGIFVFFSLIYQQDLNTLQLDVSNTTMSFDFLNIHLLGVLGGICALGIFGGFYIVPLYFMLQKASDGSHLATHIATNNIFNALFMVLASVFVALLLMLKLDIGTIFTIIALSNLILLSQFDFASVK